MIEAMRSSESSTIHVACAADAKYVQPLATMLHSLFANAGPGRAVQVHALDGGIPEEDKARIAASCTGGPHSIQWLPTTDSRFPGAPLWGRMAVSTYYKLLLAEHLPADLPKVIWLDCDLVVIGDVGRLWDEDMAGRHALATRDVVVPCVSSRSGVAGWRDLGLPAEASYFNAGVMMIDLALWRRDRVGDRALEYVKEHRDRVYFWDQEGLNAVLAGLWGELDPRWNHNVSVPAGVKKAMPRGDGDPWIVHYAGNLKPWRFVVRSTPHDLYFHYLDMTPWKGWRPSWTPMASLVGLYERVGLRRVLYPLEEWWMHAFRAMTKRAHGEEA
jgi:lipopolysaccharide biosynthesis glycosyltransferase